MEHKRTPPLKAGPGSFKRLLGRGKLRPTRDAHEQRGVVVPRECRDECAAQCYLATKARLKAGITS